MPRPANALRTMALPLLAATLAFLASPAHTAEPPTIEQGLRDVLIKADAFEAPRRLGIRAAVHRAAQRIIPTLVIVPDAGAYAQAIAAWDGHTRFPVLIDDGSTRAREDIARFARAFEPESVVRWNGTGDEWPAPRPAREARVREAWASAIGLDPDATDADAIASLRAGGVTPPGLVVTSATDPAWTGALALAAGRMQPLGFIEDPGGIPSGFWSRDKALGVEAAIERLADATGLAWNALGDDIDALTLALDAPLNFRDDTNKNETLAVSDLLGRTADGARWAWTAQLVGSESASAWRAMCALFLEAHSAWAFDAYPVTGDWTRYDNTPAVQILGDRGMNVTALDAPHSSLTDWRHATLGPIDADLVLVNTKGVPHNFDLNPGRGHAADTPHLDHPVILHLIHSFSLARGDARSGIGGRWMERGAYAQLGAVDEPYLRAFIPPRILAGRLAVGYPWAAAVRADNARLWKLAVLGDPLITLSSAGQRTPDPLPLDGASDLEDEFRDALAAGRRDEAVVALVLLGRDADAAQLVTDLLIDDQTEAITPELALAGVGPLFRAGLTRECVLVALAQHAVTTGDARSIDIAWTAARAQLADREGDRARAVALMRRMIRADQIVADTVEVGDAIKRESGPENAAAFVEEVIPLATREDDRRRLGELAADYRAGRR